MSRSERLPRAVSHLSLGLLCLFGTGCALRITPAPIEPHLAVIAEDELPRPLRLGVGLFVDKRAPEARVETHPPLRLNRIEIVRRGEVWTGDASFVGSVAAGFRRDATTTLARLGVFSSVRPVEVGDEEALAWRVGSDLDLVLTATIQEFGALQHQDSVLNLLRVGWLRSRFGDPVGFVKVRYRLYDASGRLYDYRIDADHVGAGQTITRAALDAMAVANESLARRLYADLGPPGAREHRVVPLRVLDACRLGGKRIEDLMGDVGEVFEREIGIRFRLEHQRWRDAAPRADAKAVLASIRRSVPPSDGIVLALVRRSRSRGPTLIPESFGLADPFGQHAVVGCELAGEAPTVTVIHELAHLFGAVHVHDRSSVMHDVAEFNGRFFDPLNRRILLATRERPFGAPLPVEIARRVRAIYTAASRFPECCDPAGLAAALAAVRVASQPEP